MQVKAFGLFWRRDEIEWTPGSGIKNEFRLLGRIGKNKPNLLICDFRKQQGIYVLYDEYGPAYVGLTRKQGLGKRLKDHTDDGLHDKWDRFSWFGFNEIEWPVGKIGTIAKIQDEGSIAMHTTIGDLEALLIRLVGPKRNDKVMNFDQAKKWSQINYDETEYYIDRYKSLTV